MSNAFLERVSFGLIRFTRCVLRLLAFAIFFGLTSRRNRFSSEVTRVIQTAHYQHLRLDVSVSALRKPRRLVWAPSYIFMRAERNVRIISGCVSLAHVTIASLFHHIGHNMSQPFDKSPVPTAVPSSRSFGEQADGSGCSVVPPAFHFRLRKTSAGQVGATGTVHATSRRRLSFLR